MIKTDNVTSHLAILHTWMTVDPQYGRGLDIETCKKAAQWVEDGYRLIEAYQSAWQHVIDAVRIVKGIGDQSQIYAADFIASEMGKAEKQILKDVYK